MHKTVLFAASVLIGTLTGCGDTAAPVADSAATIQPAVAESPGTHAVSAEPSESPTIARVRTTAAKAVPTKVVKPAVTATRARSGCSAVSTAKVSGSEAPYGDHPQGLQLSGGVWSSGGERLAVQRPCTTGTLENLDGTATVATLMWSTEGTTGRWWALVLCGPGKTGTQCSVQDVLDDREPIQSVTITGGDAVVVYLTRTEDVPAAGVNIRRTAIYHYHVNGLAQTSFHDEPYTP
ncbi:hypothetical protein Ahu01nite_067210 [Winogradskya humida]|uniref:LppP/LprE lipoprotein n=2 Tax=Winogradskya humida TaxID=113566 RepID=A0ABQ3ZYS2_9ACTN|nr:hypothetical protein Ahu01nite_067210 [Actinoplanes humidus]